MGTKCPALFRCITSKRLALSAVALLAMAVLAATSSAQTCLQNEYNQVQKQKLNCTANDVRIAKVTNIRDPKTGATLTSCIAGATFSFLADFEIVTSSSSPRENIGLYIATNSQTEALTGSCVDNIISPLHQCPGAAAGILCGSDNYHESDPTPDNCGDTSSGDFSGTFGAAAEKVTLEIDNFLCEAPAGSTQVQLPNCTSWQIPGGTIQCVSPSPGFPYPFNGPGATPTAIPGSPSKCNCGIIPLGITVQTPSINVAKACNTATTNSPNPPDFTNLSAPNPSSCTLSPEGGTVTYTVDMVNDKSNFGSVLIDQICDSAYGNIFTAGTFTGPACAPGSQCPAGSLAGSSCDNSGTTCSAVTIAFGASSTCTFTANQPESTTVKDVVTVSGHGSAAGSFGPTSTNSVQVVSNEAPSTATVTKGVVSTTAACATVRYSVDVANTSATGTDETLSLTGLSDSAFGGITSVHDSVLGTTCGVATSSSGLGTLSGSSGAGVLPASLPVVGSDYTCQFDAQFCSALVNSCISNTDSITASLSGDETADKVTVTANSVTVKECLTTTVQ